MKRRTRQIYEAFNRGDMKVFLLLGNDPQVELHTARLIGGIAGFDLGEVYRGHRGLLEFVERWLEAWAELRVELEEMIDCGDSIVVLMRQHGRGRGSGVEVDHAFAQLIALGRNGLAVRVDNFLDHAEALEAAGLSE
jgi:ketosteroid isomerase-like protein